MDASRLKDILGKGPGAEAGPASVGSVSDDRLRSAEAILRAVRKDDAEALDLALEDHYRACEDSKGSAEPDSDDGYSEEG